MDKIKEKIAKLLALAESSNPHEAELAAKRAYELMLKHKLELSDIEQEKDFIKELIPHKTKNLSASDRFLALALSDYFFVSILNQRIGKTKTSYFVGKPSNIANIKEVFNFLVESRNAFYKKNKKEIKIHKKSFELGFSKGIIIILEESKKETQSENNTRDLIVLEEVMLNNHIAEEYSDARKRHTSGGNIKDFKSFANGIESAGKSDFRKRIGWS